MIKFLENYCRKHIGSCLFPWRMFWIHVSHAVNFQLFWNVRNCGRVPIYFPLINVIPDMSNRNQISLTGRGEEYIHIHMFFYYFYVNLYEYDLMVFYLLHASVWFVPGWARYPSLVGCKARFSADPGNTTSFFYILVSYFCIYCTLYYIALFICRTLALG